MKITHVKNLKNQEVSSPLFTAAVKMQLPFEDIAESDLLISYVHFPKGVHNKFHKHSTDQVLIVTEGRGFVATQDKEYEVEIGDIIWTPAGQIHRHGAVPGHTFSHISITKSTSQLQQVQK